MITVLQYTLSALALALSTACLTSALYLMWSIAIAVLNYLRAGAEYHKAQTKFYKVFDGRSDEGSAP